MAFTVNGVTFDYLTFTAARVAGTKPVILSISCNITSNSLQGGITALQLRLYDSYGSLFSEVDNIDILTLGSDTFDYTLNAAVLDAGSDNIHIYLFGISSYGNVQWQNDTGIEFNIPPYMNIPPSAPGIPTFPASLSEGMKYTVAWAAAADGDGLSFYQLERSINSGAWVEIAIIYFGNPLTFEDMAQTGWNTVQYRVRAQDNDSAWGPYATSSVSDVTPVDASAGLSALAEGLKVVDPGTKYYGEPIVWIVEKKEAGKVCLSSERIIKIMAFDAQEPENRSSERALFGNNRWRLSNLQEWANSDLINWYEPTHDRDAPPTSGNVDSGYNPYDAEPGFLTNFSLGLKNVLIPVEIVAVDSPHYNWEPQQEDSSLDKVFLLSVDEIGAYPLWIEGALYPRYTYSPGGAGNRTLYPTPEAVANSNYTSPSLSSDVPCAYWLRSSGTILDQEMTYNPHYTMVISADGSLSQAEPFRGHIGFRPTIAAPDTLAISGPSGGEDYYTLYGFPPVITGTDPLGTFSGIPPIITYKVTDPADLAVVVTEELDGVLIKEYAAILGVNASYIISPWEQVLNGAHVFKVTAKNSAGGVAVREFKFNKDVTEIDFVYSNTIYASATMPTQIEKFIVNGTFPPGSILTIEVANNGFDSSPTWENVTSKAMGGLYHVFVNATKTAADWGVSLRFRLERGTAVGECCLNHILIGPIKYA